MNHGRQLDVLCSGTDMSDGTAQVTITIGNLTHDEAIAVVNALHGVVTKTVASAIEQMPGVKSATVIPGRCTESIQ